jgi:hypothetical protein
MGIKVYNRIGLRRDRNLSDLSNPTEGLNNLLDGIVVGESSTFISEDLDSIRNIASLGLKSSGYQEIISSRETFTNSNGTSSDFFPRITYQNRLDRLRLFAGEPRLYGGDGLTAKYYDRSQIYTDTVGIFSGLPFKTDNYWQSGIFDYNGKITPEAIDVNGGVEWEGYFIPYRSGEHTFYVNTTALTTFEFETQGYLGDPTGTMVSVQRYYKSSGGLHFYTTNPSREILTGYTLENREAFFVYTSQVSNTIPLYRASSPSGPHLYTISQTEYDGLSPSIWTKEGTIGYVYASAPGNITNQAVYRSYNATSGDYLLTSSLTEATTSSGYTNQLTSVFYTPYPSYVEASRIGITTTFTGTGSVNTNVITLSSAANTKYVGIGQSVSASGIVVGSVVASYNKSTGVIGLTPPEGSTYALSGNVSGNIIFYKAIGQYTQTYNTTYALEKFKKYRLRIRYYIPQNIDAFSVLRYINFYIFRPARSSDERLRYNNLYSTNYDFSDASKGEFVKFLDNSINFGGGTCGGTSLDKYVKIQTSKKVDIKYEPKTSVDNVIKLTISGTTTLNSNIGILSSTSGLEFGNYVYGTNITDGTTIKDIVVNQFVILSANATVSGTNNLTFVDHRGLVKRAVGSSSGAGNTTFTLSSGNTTDLKSGMIMIGSGVQAYTGITTTGSATVFNISPSQTIGAGTTVYFYQSRGLVNNALAPFCPPAANKCLFVSVAAGIGSTTIQVKDTSGISVGWTVQGYQFASNTTVTKIVSTGTTSISLSKGITNSLIVGGNFTVTNGTEDKQLCCPPTDTSPPFNPTVDGLETVSGATSLRIDSGNIVFDALKVGIANTITTATASDVSGSRLSIKTPSGTFKILCD